MLAPMQSGPVRRPGTAARFLLRVPGWLYRWRAGWLLGGRFLRLGHIGRRTGRRYETVVEVIGHDPGRWLVMSGFGRDSDWFRNVTASGHAEVTVGRHTYPVAVRELPAREAAAVLAGYEQRNLLVAPVVHAVLSRQVGWRYRGETLERERLVRQLPIVEMTRH